MNFAQTLKALMEEKKITSYRLSKMTGVHQTTISNWLNGKSYPNAKSMQKIANALDIDVSKLFNFQNEDMGKLIDFISDKSPKSIVARLDVSDDDDDAELYIDISGTPFSEVRKRTHENLDKLNDFGLLRVAGYIDDLLEDETYQEKNQQENKPSQK